MSKPRIIPASEAKRLREDTKNIGTWWVEHDDMEDQWDITWERHFSNFSATMQIGHAYGEGTAWMFAAAPDLAATVIAQADQIKRLQAALREAEVKRRQVWVEMGADIDPHGAVDWETQYDTLAAEDMEDTDD